MTTPGINLTSDPFAVPPLVIYLLILLGSIGFVTAILEFRQARKTGVI